MTTVTNLLGLANHILEEWKMEAHKLSEQEYKDLCKEIFRYLVISCPFAFSKVCPITGYIFFCITAYYSLYTDGPACWASGLRSDHGGTTSRTTRC